MTEQYVYVVMQSNDRYEDRDAEDCAIHAFRNPRDAVDAVRLHVNNGSRITQLDPKDLEFTDDELVDLLVNKQREYPFHSGGGIVYRIETLELE